MMSDETTLLPCPFCGGEAKLSHYETFDNDEWAVECMGVCEIQPATCLFFTKEQAIEAWNTRAERTCHLINDIESYDTTMRVIGSCSECGHIVCGPDWFCHHCGAKVIEEVDNAD